MRKLTSLILFASFLLAACQPSAPDPESHYERVSRQIEQLKTQAAATAGGNIKIVANMLTAGAVDYDAVNTLWRYVNQNVTVVKRPDVFFPSALKIGLAAGDFKARLDIVKDSLKRSEETELFILVSEGVPGYINIGTEIYVPRFYYSGRWYRAVDYEFRRAGKSLKVVARRLPAGLVEMQLTPVFSRFLSDGGDIELTELTTTVTARPGQAVVIGGSSGVDESVASALFAKSRTAEKSQTLITVTAYLQ
jgi:hypothetical protein